MAVKNDRGTCATGRYSWLLRVSVNGRPPSDWPGVCLAPASMGGRVGRQSVVKYLGVGFDHTDPPKSSGRQMGLLAMLFPHIRQYLEALKVDYQHIERL